MNTEDNDVRQYKALCAERDRVNAETEPLIAAREVASVEAQNLNAKANDLSDEIWNVRGGPRNWLGLKKEIGRLARLTSGKKIE